MTTNKISSEDLQQVLRSEISESCNLLSALESQKSTLVAIAGALRTALRDRHKVLTCGNGGSAAEAQHLATELTGRFRAQRRSLPALFLGADVSALTCIANDFSFDEVFSRPLSAHGQPGDVVFCFSTSGNPTNVVNALEAARRLGLQSVALLGGDGGRARGRASWEVIVPSRDTARVQEVHLFVLHWLCARVDEALDGAGG